MNWNMKISIRQVETTQSLITIDCLTDLTVSILNGCFLIYRFSKERSITGRNFPFLLVQGIVGSKSREFTDFVPFPLPVSGEEFRSLLEVTGRKIDSTLSELTTGEELT